MDQAASTSHILKSLFTLLYLYIIPQCVLKHESKDHSIFGQLQLFVYERACFYNFITISFI